MKILIIDDDKHLSGFLKSSLEAEGFVADTAIKGEEGIFMALTNSYDIIISDLNLPDLNGRDVCREIRQGGKETPILVLSVDSEVGSKISLLNIGADDYLSKPFSFQELLARIKALSRRQKNIVNETLEYGRLALDICNQIATVDNHEIYLTCKEFMILEYMMKNRGKVVTRSELLEHVWNSEMDHFSNTVETHILHLRCKLDKVKRDAFIKTLPGRGYRLKE